MVAGKVSGHGRPHVSRLTVAMQQDDSCPRTAKTHVYGGAADWYAPGGKFCRKLKGAHLHLHLHLHLNAFTRPANGSSPGFEIDPLF